MEHIERKKNKSLRVKFKQIDTQKRTHTTHWQQKDSSITWALAVKGTSSVIAEECSSSLDTPKEYSSKWECNIFVIFRRLIGLVRILKEGGKEEDEEIECSIDLFFCDTLLPFLMIVFPLLSFSSITSSSFNFFCFPLNSFLPSIITFSIFSSSPSPSFLLFNIPFLRITASAFLLTKIFLSAAVIRVAKLAKLVVESMDLVSTSPIDVVTPDRLVGEEIAYSDSERIFGLRRER